MWHHLDMTKFQQVGKIIAKIVEGVPNIYSEYTDETVCYEHGLHSLNF
jgi:hypothetical protein